MLLPKFIRIRISGRIDILAVLHNAGWLLADKFIRLFLGVFVSAWVARYLGPEEFGELAYVLAYLAFFQAVATLGMDGIVVRDISREVSKEGEILGTVFTLRLLVGGLLWVSAIVGMGITKGWSERGLWLVAIAGSTLVFQVADTVDLWFQSQSQSKRTVVAKMIAYLGSSLIKVALVLSEAPLILFAAVLVVESVFAVAALTYAYKRFQSPNRWTFIGKRAWVLLSESWPFMLSGLSIMIYMRIDQLMISELLGDRALGVYAAMIPFSSLWHVIPMTMCVSLAPYIARKKALGEQSYYDALLYIFRFFLALSVCISLSISVLANFLIDSVYGVQYLEAADVLKIHVFSCIPVFLGVAQGLWVLNEKKSRLAIIKTATGAVCSVCLNLILIPRFGLEGAAIAAVCSQVCAAILINILVAPKIFIMLFGFRWCSKYKVL